MATASRSSAALPIAHVTIRILVWLSCLMGVLIVALLVRDDLEGTV